MFTVFICCGCIFKWISTVRIQIPVFYWPCSKNAKNKIHFFTSKRFKKLFSEKQSFLLTFKKYLKINIMLNFRYIWTFIHIWIYSDIHLIKLSLAIYVSCPDFCLVTLISVEFLFVVLNKIFVKIGHIRWQMGKITQSVSGKLITKINIEKGWEWK